LICAPFSFLIASMGGSTYIVSGLSFVLIALAFLLIAILLAIYYPIRALLRREPSDLLRYQ
ncbi:MAG: hypothetical protein WD005_06490, partial [Haliea sp.]